MAVLFLGAFQASITWSGQDMSAASLAFAGLPALVITLWGLLAARRVLALEDFERRVAVNALAITLLVTVWFVTVWGLLSQFAGVVELNSILVAPIAAFTWQITWFVLRARYL